MTRPPTAPKSRFLVLHDYGMGGLWWWIHARSAREILEAFAEVEVVDGPDDMERARSWDLPEVDIDEPTMPPAPLGWHRLHRRLVWVGRGNLGSMRRTAALARVASAAPLPPVPLGFQRLRSRSCRPKG
jgi:hypothetical protein